MQVRKVVRALLVEDHAMVAEMLTKSMESAGFEVVGWARSVDEGLAHFTRHRPDFVLCDVQLLHGGSGIELTRLIRETAPDALVVMLSAENEAEVVTDALAAGAAGYVSKGAGTPELFLAINEALSGIPGVADRDTYRKLAMALNSSQAAKASPAAQTSLTRREMETLQHMAAGAISNKDLAAAMGIAENSARTHASNILTKLGVHRRGEAVAAAFRLGLINPPAAHRP